MKPGIIIYDGIRHFFLIIPAMMLIAALGLCWLFDFLRYKSYEVISCCLLLLIIVPQIVMMHPYEGSYVNEVTRLVIPEHVENYFEVEYWGLTYKEGVHWLNTYARTDAIVCVPLSPHLIPFYQTRKDIRFGCHKDSDYMMFFTRNYHYLIPHYVTLLTSEPIYTIERYHSDLLYIYEINH